MNLKISIISPLVALALGACDLPNKNLGETNTESAGDSSTAVATEGESTASDPGPTTGPGTTDQTTAMSGDTSTTEETAGTTSEPGEEDFVEMGQCMLPVVCEPATQDFVEGSPYHSEPDLPGIQCVWAGLRDGIPGRYTWIINTSVGTRVGYASS